MRIALFLTVLFLGAAAAQVSDLKLAWDAAFVSLVASGEYARITASDPTNLYVADCIASPDRYPFPQPPTGDLAQVLSRGTLFIGDAGGSPTLPLVDTTTNPPTGWLTELQRAILGKISAAYGKNLSIKWVYFDSSAEAFTGLINGVVDVLGSDFSMGGFFNGERRNVKFHASCAVGSTESSIYVPATSTLKTLADVKALGNKLRVATIGAGSVQLASAVFPGASVTDLSSTGATPDEVVGQAASGKFDATFDLDPNVPNPKARRIGSGVIGPIASFFRRSAPPPPPTPESVPAHTVNLNFGGILQK